MAKKFGSNLRDWMTVIYLDTKSITKYGTVCIELRNADDKRDMTLY